MTAIRSTINNITLPLKDGVNFDSSSSSLLANPNNSSKTSIFTSLWSLPGIETNSAEKQSIGLVRLGGSQEASNPLDLWSDLLKKSANQIATYRDEIKPQHKNNQSNNFPENGITGTNQGFTGIANDGNSDPLYDASKHTKEENQKISDMMTIVNSSSSSETSKATAATGEFFTAAFSQGIEEGKSLQDVIRSLDGANLRGAQTSQAYNTEKMSSKPISASNKTNGTAIILRGSNDGVETPMEKDEANLKGAYTKLGFDVKVVHSEKEFEKALLDARQKAIEDKAQGKESVLATHVISHGLQVGGTKGADANAALAMKSGALYHEKDIIGDIAGALEPEKDGKSPFAHSYNAFTACHSGGFDNEQTLVGNSRPEEEKNNNS